MTRRKGAIIGWGFIAEKGHRPAYAASEALEIVAVADPCEPRRRAAARAMPGARIYADHRALLAEEARALDFVDVCTPPYAHAEIAHAALDCGLHVLCEKPLATTTADARALLDHAALAQRVLYPVQNYRHAPVIRAVREVLASGVIGFVHQVTLSTYRSTHALGVPEWRPDWRRERSLSGGGIAMDHGSHTLYLAFEWLRSYPTAVTAKMATHGPFDTEDLLTGTVTFPTGTATMHLSWTAGARKVIYTLHGERGAVRVEDDDVEVTLAAGRGWTTSSQKVSSHWMDAGHAAWFGSMFVDFATAIDRREWVGRAAEDALRCVELITSAYASSAAGCREVALLGKAAAPASARTRPDALTAE